MQEYYETLWNSLNQITKKILIKILTVLYYLETENIA